MNAYLYNDAGFFIAIGVIALVVIRWHAFGVLHRLSLLNFAALLLHQFKELGGPGGFPPFINKVLLPNDRPDRYPFNQNDNLFIKVWCANPF